MTYVGKLHEAIIDLLAILDSPHTSVSVRHETGAQYRYAKLHLQRLISEEGMREHGYKPKEGDPFWSTATDAPDGAEG